MTNCKPYVRTVQYYETDQMAIVHHSNYIRWFEEARLDHLQQLGICYRALEEQGLRIPVVEISCKYLVSAKYADTLEITPFLTAYTGVRMSYRYEVRQTETGILLAEGTSSHCFLDHNGIPVSLKRKMPELHQLLLKLVP